MPGKEKNPARQLGFVDHQTEMGMLIVEPKSHQIQSLQEKQTQAVAQIQVLQEEQLPAHPQPCCLPYSFGHCCQGL